jgi:hypothetical protein
MKKLAFLFLAASIAACSTSSTSKLVASEHLIIGPKGYTVDWGLPETGDYWLPPERENDIKAASDACGALHACSSIITHRDRLGSATSGCISTLGSMNKKKCVLARLEAVPALTIYPQAK